MARLLSVLIVIIGLTSFAPAPQYGGFEGELHYRTTYTYFPPELARYRNVLPTEFDIYIRRNLVTKEGPTAMANGWQIHIKNMSTQTGYTAMSTGNTYVAYRKGAPEFQSELDAMPTPINIEYVNETRQIAGYVCKKALVFLPNFKDPFTVFYTEKIPAEAHIVYKGLKGFPVYFEGDMNGVRYYSEAVGINPGKQADGKFMLPRQYQLVSYQEFKNALIKKPSFE